MKSLDTVEMYDTRTAAWSALPNLNKGRQNHAMTALGSVVYAFLGAVKGEDKKLHRNGRIEKLNLGVGVEAARWQEIVIDDRAGRGHLGVAPVSQHEILILGGFGLRDMTTNEHYLFDVNTE